VELDVAAESVVVAAAVEGAQIAVADADADAGAGAGGENVDEDDAGDCNYGAAEIVRCCLDYFRVVADFPPVLLELGLACLKTGADDGIGAGESVGDDDDGGGDDDDDTDEHVGVFA
jgi:hypothetical protein